MSLETELAGEHHASGQKIRAFAILNPKSGSCTADDVRKAIADHLAGAEVEVHEVAKGDDIHQLVVAAIGRGCDPIVAAGGDGTVSVVANALIGTEAHLVVIPLGTANVLARELGIPVELDGAVRLGAHRMGLGSLAGSEHAVARIDAMKIGDRHYFTQVGVGIDALMIRDTDTEQKRRFGRVAYLWTAARSLVGYRPRRFVLEVDGRTVEVRATQIVVANTGMMGQPPFRWGPGIRSHDGKLDICIIKGRSIKDYLGVLYRIFRHQHKRSPNVRYEIAERSITISPKTKHKNPSPVQADGEVVGEVPIRIEVVAGAMKVVAPAGHDSRDLG